MTKVLKFGLLGLGNAGNQVLPAFLQSESACLIAAGDPQPLARERFAQTTGLPAVSSLDELLRHNVDAIWIATPNEFHAENAIAAAKLGCHVICEKPMALTLDQCDQMIATAKAHGTKLMLGHSKLIDPPIRKMREILDSGRLGEVIQLSMQNYNDWLQRPRFANEVDTRQGGGICYRQAPHQIDIARYLVGKPVHSVRALVGRADPHFSTEGHYSALIGFLGGTAATLSYNAYGYFDISELTWNIGEGGQKIPPIAERKPKPRLTGPVEGNVKNSAAAARHGRTKDFSPFYGLTVVSCERGVLRQSPRGIFIYDEAGCREVLCEQEYSIERDLAELASAIERERAPFPDGEWGRTTTAICRAILDSSEKGAEIFL